MRFSMMARGAATNRERPLLVQVRYVKKYKVSKQSESCVKDKTELKAQKSSAKFMDLEEISKF